MYQIWAWAMIMIKSICVLLPAARWDWDNLFAFITYNIAGQQPGINQ